MPWDGDISRMGKLADRIADLATVPSRAAARVAEELGEEIQGEFDSGHDPYGDAWEPLAESTVARGRHEPPLTDTEAMRNSLRVFPLHGSGVGVTIAHPAPAHQTGWSGKRGSGPARPILPMRGDLPDTWQDVIEGAIADEIRKRGRR